MGRTAAEADERGTHRAGDSRIPRAPSRAQDTFEGIAEWWLLERWVRHETGEVRAALDRLVAAGRLGQRRGRDGRMHYRLSGVEP